MAAFVEDTDSAATDAVGLDASGGTVVFSPPPPHERCVRSSAGSIVGSGGGGGAGAGVKCSFAARRALVGRAGGMVGDDGGAGGDVADVMVSTSYCDAEAATFLTIGIPSTVASGSAAQRAARFRDLEGGVDDIRGAREVNV